MNGIRLAVIGAGAAGDHHLRAAARVRGVDVVGVCDSDRGLRESGAASVGASAYEDSDAVFSDRAVDAVIIATPASTHLGLAAAALRAGKHVLIEKPVSDDAAAIRRIAARAQALGLVAMPGHNYVYLPEARRMVEAVRRGELGAPRAAFMTYAISHAESLAALYGPVLSEVMVHHAYLAYACFGRPTSMVAGQSRPGWSELATSDRAG